MNQNTSLEIRDCTALGSEICRELCDGLMQYQASMAKEESHRKILGSMCYDNRLKPSFESTRRSCFWWPLTGNVLLGTCTRRPAW